MPWTLNMHHSSHFNAFSQSKSTKCEIFAWNFDFSGTTYHRDLKPVPLDLHALNPKYAPLKPFQCIFPVKINKMWFEIWIFQHALHTYELNMHHSNHFNVFSLKSTKCEIFAWNFDFSGTTYHRDLKPDWILTTQAISMHYSQSKSTKCEIFGCLLNSGTLINKLWNLCHWIWQIVPWTLEICTHSSHFNAFYPVKINKMWNFCLKFWVCWSQCTMLECCVTSTFWVMMIFLDFWQEGLGKGFWNMV